jgi:hypothetical protein
MNHQKSERAITQQSEVGETGEEMWNAGYIMTL